MVALNDAVVAALENPFAGAAAGPAPSTRAQHPALDRPAQQLHKWLARGRVREAELLLLAAGHLQALGCAGDPLQILATDTVPARLWRALPRRRGSYLRMLAAAGRCAQALCQLRGSSAAMQGLRASVWEASFGTSIADALDLEAVVMDHDLLLLGETGTGKELVAGALLAARPGGNDGGPSPAAAINAAAVPETLIGSELFGHVRGAFTGASQDRLGRIRSAHGGCLFLDEIGDLPPTTQVQLLRVMETDQVQPLGSDVTHTAAVRYITATHRDLQAMVESGAFRRDLFHRIADQIIRLPPLREHPEDIADIGMAFIEQSLPQGALPATRERAHAFLNEPALRRHPFAGNVRELRNMLRSVMLGRVPRLSRSTRPARSESATKLPPAIAARTATLREVEQWYIEGVLRDRGNNVSQAARALGVDRSTVSRRTGGDGGR